MSLVIPYFDYCGLVWDNCSNYLLDNLQRMQNNAARIIEGKHYEFRSMGLFKELIWKTFKERMYRRRMNQKMCLC